LSLSQFILQTLQKIVKSVQSVQAFLALQENVVLLHRNSEKPPEKVHNLPPA
jgi:hypothetical protein